jgi:Zn-dependent peptidase ImmA (M78 family)
MGKMKEFVMEIQEMIRNSSMDFVEIANYFGVPVQVIYEIAEDMGEYDD